MTDVGLAAVIVVVFAVGVVIGRLTTRFTVTVIREDPPDVVSYQRLVQLRRM